jgi:5-methylcytosine-specific restriction endonuclease McrA
MVEVTCKVCQKAFLRKSYHAAKGGNQFCGFACYGLWQRTHRVGTGRKRVMLRCFTCNIQVERQLYQAASGKRVFCSRACHNKWRSSDDWRGANNPAWLGGHSQYRGPNWKTQSRAARTRDSYSCQRCLSPSERLEVHHIRPFALFSDYKEANKLTNLITLCPSCHGKEEVAFWKGHPELMQFRNPLAGPITTCHKCEQLFVPRSGAHKVCDECCTRTCAFCGNLFTSRRATQREVKFCTRDCWHAFVRQPMLQEP